MNNKKKAIQYLPLNTLILFILILSSYIWAEDSNNEESKPLINKSFSMYLQRDSGNSITPLEKGTISESKIGSEINFLSHFSFGFGISKSQINLQDRTWNSNLIIGGLLIANSANIQGNTEQELQAKEDSYAIGSIFLLGPTKYNYNPTNLNFDLNLHWNTENFIDPYLGVGYQFGVYSTVESFSSISGWKGKVGVKINFSNYYFFLHGEYQKLTIKDTEFFSAFYLTNKVASFGIGYYFQ